MQVFVRGVWSPLVVATDPRLAQVSLSFDKSQWAKEIKAVVITLAGCDSKKKACKLRSKDSQKVSGNVDPICIAYAVACILAMYMIVTLNQCMCTA